jgi:hypothetical protein
MLNFGPTNIFSLLCLGAEIQDGVKIQNGAQKRKIRLTAKIKYFRFRAPFWLLTPS